MAQHVLPFLGFVALVVVGAFLIPVALPDIGGRQAS
jgi:hypothetical protein